MAENPAYWGPATKLISEKLTEIAERDPELCGWTSPMIIAQGLKEAGFLSEEDVFVDEQSPATAEPEPFGDKTVRYPVTFESAAYQDDLARFLDRLAGGDQ